MADVHAQGSVQGRALERETVREVVLGAGMGRSGVLVVHGEAGIGKTTLLEEAAATAHGYQVLRVQGVESEAGLGFAALHRLLSPLAGAWKGLPPPQRRALEVTFGLGDGPVPDRFLVGLATLTLLDDAARAQPVLCVIDDGQWLDVESLAVLSFVARRLEAESVAMLFAFRVPAGSRPDLPEGLPHLEVGPMLAGDAERLLRSVVASPIDAAVAERLLAECAGSPLAIVELASVLTPGQLISADLLPDALPVGERLVRHYLGRVDALPAEVRTVLLVAAVDTTGDPTVVLAAASALGVGGAAADPAETAGIAETAGLVRLTPEVRFRHPLVRSAILSGAPPASVREAHRALADAVDGEHLDETRVWHRAGATVGTDDAVADALDERARIAHLRGSTAAEAALRTRSAELTSEPGPRARRQIAAAHAHFLAGAPRRAAHLVDTLPPGVRSDLERAEATRLRALLASFTTPGPVPGLLLGAADLARRDDPLLAHIIDTEAIQATLVSCQLTTGITPRQVAERVLQASPDIDCPLTVVDQLRAGFAYRLAGEHRRSAELLDQALDGAAGLDGEGLHELERWTVFVNNLPAELWDLERTSALLDRIEGSERERGSLENLRITLGALGHIRMWRGQFTSAEAAHSEAAAIAVALGADPVQWEALKVELHAWRGDTDTVRFMAELMTGEVATSVGAGVFVNVGRSALMILGLGQGRYEDALATGRAALDDDVPPQGSHVLPDVVEAAVRCDEPEVALRALGRLEERAALSPTPWSNGVLARSRALLADGEVAERCYLESTAALERSGLVTELARSHLVHGEWLRRRNRRVDAREQLRIAHDHFARMGARAFEERARIELAATGERARRRGADTALDLTPQELQIAALAADGMTNREIAASLFISASTVDYHLRKVFRKVGVSSRRQLRRVLPR